MSWHPPELTPRGPLSLRMSMRVDSMCGRLESGTRRVVERSDPVAVARRVDAVCEGFEAAYRRGDAPRIEDHLPHRDDPAWNPLFRELIGLDRELRRDRGEPAAPGEYLARFPDDAEALAGRLFEVGDEAETQTTPWAEARRPRRDPRRHADRRI